MKTILAMALICLSFSTMASFSYLNNMVYGGEYGSTKYGCGFKITWDDKKGIVEAEVVKSKANNKYCGEEGKIITYRCYNTKTYCVRPGWDTGRRYQPTCYLYKLSNVSVTQRCDKDHGPTITTYYIQD